MSWARRSIRALVCGASNGDEWRSDRCLHEPKLIVRVVAKNLQPLATATKRSLNATVRSLANPMPDGPWRLPVVDDIGERREDREITLVRQIGYCGKRSSVLDGAHGHLIHDGVA